MEQINIIARMHSDFATKFGIPRQSGLAPSVKSVVEFCEGYRDENCIRDIEQYSHLWLIWGFSKNENQWSPTVRPPRLGGNKRVGVFATRSPFRPNPIGLSCVRLLRVDESKECGKILVVDGNSIINRAFYGVPLLTNGEGKYTNGVYGFLNILFKLMDEEKPDHLAVAFDLKAPTFRHEMYSEYKAGRKGMPEELAVQLPYAKKCMSSDLKRLEDLCKKIDKLQTASPSLDRMLEISNGLKLLEAEQAQAELHAVQEKVEKVKKTTRRKTK